MFSSLIGNLSLVFVMEFQDFRRPYFQLNVVFDFFKFNQIFINGVHTLASDRKRIFSFWQRKCTSFVVCYFSHRHNTEQGFHRECCVHIHNLPNHVSRGLHARVILAGYAQVILVRYAQARGLASFLFAFSPSACFVVRHRIKTCVLFQPINFLVKELIYIILWDHHYSRGFHCQSGSLCKRMTEHSTSCVQNTQRVQDIAQDLLSYIK